MADSALFGGRPADSRVLRSWLIFRNEPPGSNSTRPDGSIFTGVSGPTTCCPRPARSASTCNCRSRPPDAGATPHENAINHDRAAASGPATADNTANHPPGLSRIRRYCPGEPGFSCQIENPVTRPPASLTACIAIEYEPAGAAPASNPATASSARSDSTSSGDGNKVPTRVPSSDTHGRISTPVRSTFPPTINVDCATTSGWGKPAALPGATIRAGLDHSPRNHLGEPGTNANIARTASGIGNARIAPFSYR
ncbi:hypothetical protein GCM10009565_52920 [Amycolatopsis albidoflavus]